MADKPNAGDDLEAVRTIANALEPFDPADQERIIRWAREKVGLGLPVSETAVASKSPQAATTQTPQGSAPPVGKRDLRSFIAEKQPSSDTHFATAVAYFYQFEAPDSERKDSITADDLREATRLADRQRLSDPGQTLRNAVQTGLLDRADTGSYRINAVGENLVAMTLPGRGTPDRKKSPAKRQTGSRKKTGSKKKTGSRKKTAKSTRARSRKKASKSTGRRKRG